MWLGNKPGRWISNFFDIHCPTNRRRWRLNDKSLKVPTTFISGDEVVQWSLSPGGKQVFIKQGKKLINILLSRRSSTCPEAYRTFKMNFIEVNCFFKKLHQKCFIELLMLLVVLNVCFFTVSGLYGVTRK